MEIRHMLTHVQHEKTPRSNNTEVDWFIGTKEFFFFHICLQHLVLWHVNIRVLKSTDKYKYCFGREITLHVQVIHFLLIRLIIDWKLKFMNFWNNEVVNWCSVEILCLSAILVITLCRCSFRMAFFISEKQNSLFLKLLIFNLMRKFYNKIYIQKFKYIFRQIRCSKKEFYFNFTFFTRIVVDLTLCVYFISFLFS